MSDLQSSAPAYLAHNTWWLRDAANPILPPGEAGSFDDAVCMNPWVLVVDDQYLLYYSGGRADGTRRICLATASVADPHRWTRHGPLFDVGPPGSFDAQWCVIPHVVRVAPDLWHLYYTGRSDHGEGLSAFKGLGLAVSKDGRHWEKHPANPVLAPSRVPGSPDEMGMAGGSVIRARLPDGSYEWRFYYTGCPTLGEDVFLDQQKRVCLAASPDGVRWTRRGALILRNPDHDYENVATASGQVLQGEDGTYRLWHSAIGTRWGYYSICYAESDDGAAWRRGRAYGDNLQLGPTGSGWERQMVEYPSVVVDPRHGRLRLFYCGNGYGASGIGTAVAAPLRAVPERGGAALRVTSPAVRLDCLLHVPAALTVDGDAVLADRGDARWHGPDATGTYWHEWHDPDGTDGLQYRAIVGPAEDGLRLRLTVINGRRRPLRNVGATAHATAGLQIAWEPADASPDDHEAGRPATVRVDELPGGATHTFRALVALAPRQVTSADRQTETATTRGLAVANRDESRR